MLHRCLALAFACCGIASASEVAPAPRMLPDPPMPLTGLSPSKPFENLCLLKYPISTTSPECQKFCDQALGFYYSYVWIEAARSFETSLKHDPECAIAWLGLHRSLEKWGGGSKSPSPAGFGAIAGAGSKIPDRFAKSPRDFSIDQAKALLSKASHREQLLITAKLQEKGMLPGVTPEERKKKATATLDELLTLYDDDEEGWFARAQIAEGQYAAAPFYKMLLKVNPLHPGANHEFVHFYENIRRPGLGWPYAEKYIESSPGIPHAFHMQAHLGTRIGKWQQTSDWSSKAVELQKAYHKYQGVKPSEDHQFNHHMDILTKSLVHDGRFAEVKLLQADAKGYGYTFRNEWFRTAVAQKDWAETTKTIEAMRKTDKPGAAYHAAIVALELGDVKKAQAEVDILRDAGTKRPGAGRNEYRAWEVQGRLLCQTGQVVEGCKLFKRIIEKTKNDFGHHAWGGGAYYMEAWGIAALEGGSATEAEEAFQEALAHDAGSARGALGLWALCERLGRTEEAYRYLKVAHKAWAKAEPKDFESLKADMGKRALKVPVIPAASSVSKPN